MTFSLRVAAQICWMNSTRCTNQAVSLSASLEGLQEQTASAACLLHAVF